MWATLESSPRSKGTQESVREKRRRGRKEGSVIGALEERDLWRGALEESSHLYDKCAPLSLAEKEQGE